MKNNRFKNDRDKNIDELLQNSTHRTESTAIVIIGAIFILIGIFLLLVQGPSVVYICGIIALIGGFVLLALATLLYEQWRASTILMYLAYRQEEIDAYEEEQENAELRKERGE